ncbi:hypothetical protein [Labilibacter marinus]|uniref:hypothetical protein n=1 Tax=Labilibacter marinus TaxID=1477105 RepID=UPI000831E0E4|nr:hypothetical protein [Labilibacter marinus]
MKEFALLVFVVILKTSAYSQLFNKTTYVKAEIISLSDTIKCYVMQKDYYKGNIKYKFGVEDKKVERIHESVVLSIDMGEIFFNRIYVRNTPYLMKCICKGKISIYEHLIYNYNYNSLTVTGGGLGGGPSKIETKYLVKQSKTFEIKRRKINDILNELMADDKELVENVKNFDRKDIIWDFKLKQLVNRYNRNARYNDIQ